MNGGTISLKAEVFPRTRLSYDTVIAIEVAFTLSEFSKILNIIV